MSLMTQSGRNLPRKEAIEESEPWDTCDREMVLSMHNDISNSASFALDGTNS
jgi:hypothetical protein